MPGTKKLDAVVAHYNYIDVVSGLTEDLTIMANHFGYNNLNDYSKWLYIHFE